MNCLSPGDVPSPDGHGWSVSGRAIAIVWRMRVPAPSALLELVHCGCTTGCSKERCRCFKSKLPGTDACRCIAWIAMHLLSRHHLTLHADDENDDRRVARTVWRGL